MLEEASRLVKTMKDFNQSRNHFFCSLYSILVHSRNVIVYNDVVMHVQLIDLTQPASSF